ncbi:MAG: OmpH family outer membrane protein [Rhodothermales bacterium]|jgi:outer membrane protein
MTRFLFRISAVALGLVFVTLAAGTAQAQQKIGYIDSDYILNNMPDYATIQQQLDRMAQTWQTELDEAKAELDDKFREYQARELLYTNEERQRRRQEILQEEEDLERLRVKYFGPEGDIFLQQEQLMRPVQERILQAINTVATSEGYDYIFDSAGDFLFMFKRDQYNLSDTVLRELGIDVESTRG